MLTQRGAALSSAANLPPQITAPIIFGCNGFTLEADEKAFFKDASPAGFIVFKKNCDTPEQLTTLVRDLRDCVGWNAPVLIDQEGGRVQRLRPPHWPDFPAWRKFGDLYASQPAKAEAALVSAIEGLAAVQCPMGIDVDCVPVLDIVPPGIETRAIDDRALGAEPARVSALGLLAARASVATGMTPVMKHIPGHGRATVDSHHDLPKVTADLATLEATDFVPFKAVTNGMDDGTLWAMTCHVIYTAIDPELPATLSATVINDIIRKAVGFDGLLLTDDLFMNALAPWGGVPQRAALSLKAGCDLALHCHGTVAERTEAMTVIPPMSAKTRVRLDKWAVTRKPEGPRKPVDTLLSEVALALA